MVTDADSTSWESEGLMEMLYAHTDLKQGVRLHVVYSASSSADLRV